MRRKTRQINIGGVKIGGGAPVSIQSMTKTDTCDVAATLRQIKALEKAGCDIVRIAVKDKDATAALAKIMKKTPLPVEADIHFNYRLALSAIENGADAVRLNPGNIYKKEEVEAVAKEAKSKKIPIRVGINSGSLVLAGGTGRGRPARGLSGRSAGLSGDRTRHAASSMVCSALEYIKMLEKMNFYDINVSLKASDVVTTVDAYRLLAKKCDYPLHLGVTAAGLPEEGAVKSAIGIGSLLIDGIGDTIRVSLAGDPVQEVEVAKTILSSLGLRKFGPELIVCPTCGRTQIDVIGLAEKIKKQLSTHPSLRSGSLERSRASARDNQQPTTRSLKVAVMGCEVNGPGEARDADIGIAGGKGCGILFKKGKIIKKIPEKSLVKALLKNIPSLP